jgi:hypothetical protein
MIGTEVMAIKESVLDRGRHGAVKRVPFNDRDLEMQWIARNRAAVVGKWVAL